MTLRQISNPSLAQGLKKKKKNHLIWDAGQYKLEGGSSTFGKKKKRTEETSLDVSFNK